MIGFLRSAGAAARRDAVPTVRSLSLPGSSAPRLASPSAPSPFLAALPRLATSPPAPSPFLAALPGLATSSPAPSPSAAALLRLTRAFSSKPPPGLNRFEKCFYRNLAYLEGSRLLQEQAIRDSNKRTLQAMANVITKLEKNLCEGKEKVETTANITAALLGLLLVCALALVYCLTTRAEKNAIARAGPSKAAAAAAKTATLAAKESTLAAKEAKEVVKDAKEAVKEVKALVAANKDNN